MIFIINHIDVKDHLGLASLSYFLDGIFDKHIFMEGEEIGGHDSAGRILFVFQKLLDLLRVLILHNVEDFQSLFPGKIIDHIL